MIKNEEEVKEEITSLCSKLNCEIINFPIITENSTIKNINDIELKCSRCGKSYKIKLTSLRRKKDSICKECNSSDIHSYNEDIIFMKCKEICSNLGCNLITVLFPESNKAKDIDVVIECSNCHKKYKISYSNLLVKISSVCLSCASKFAHKITEEEVIRKSIDCCNKLGNCDFVRIIKFGIYKDIDIELRCKNCGNCYVIKYRTILKTSSGLCQICCQTSKLENFIYNFLSDNSSFEEQRTFSWLKYKNNLKLDFYLPEYNIAIECQGEQHFRPIDWFGGEEKFRLQQERDLLKYNLCKEHGITILYYTDLPQSRINFFAPVYTDINELLNEIKKYIN